MTAQPRRDFGRGGDETLPELMAQVEQTWEDSSEDSSGDEVDSVQDTSRCAKITPVKTDPHIPIKLEDRVSPPSSVNWREPGRTRGRLNLSLDRIETNTILSNYFVDDANTMLDRIRGWPRADARMIMKSFRHDPLNAGKQVAFTCRRTGNRREWHVSVRDLDMTVNEIEMSVPHKDELDEEGRLPEQCETGGCDAGCPRKMTEAASKARLLKAADIRRSEETLTALGCATDVSSGRRAIVDKWIMPPPRRPLKRAEANSEPVIQPAKTTPLQAGRQTVEDTPHACPASPRLTHYEFHTKPHDDRTLQAHPKPSKWLPNPRPTCAKLTRPLPNLFPPETRPHPFSSRRSFYSKRLPPLHRPPPPPQPAVLNTSATAIEPTSSTLLSTRKTPRRKPKRLKRHVKLESWQADPDRYWRAAAWVWHEHMRQAHRRNYGFDVMRFEGVYANPGRGNGKFAGYDASGYFADKFNLVRYPGEAVEGMRRWRSRRGHILCLGSRFGWVGV